MNGAKSKVGGNRGEKSKLFYLLHRMRCVKLASTFLLLCFVACLHLIYVLLSSRHVTKPPVGQVKVVKYLNISGSLGLTPEVAEFLEVTRKYSIDHFLVEPCRLWTLLETKLKRKLIKRKAVPKDGISCNKTTFGHSLYSFGIYEEENKKISVTFEREMTSLGFEMSSYFDPKDKGLTHFLLYKKTTVIHVSVFYKRNTWLLIKPLGHNLTADAQRLSNSDLSFGQFTASYDAFDLLDIINGNNILRIPKLMSYFLLQIKYSKFIECNKTSAEALSKSHPNLTHFDANMDSKVKGSIELVQLMMKTLLIPIWMDGGTLLGWNRQCGAIPYDHDMDTASFGIYNDGSYELTKEMDNVVPEPWKLIEIYGFPWLAYQLRVWNFRTGWGVDVFWAFDNLDENYSFGYHPDPGKKFCQLLYPKTLFDSLCSAELNGLKILVPCKPEDVHRAEYGPDWMIPNKKFGVLNSGGCENYWEPRESCFSYQCTSARSGIRESASITAATSLGSDRSQDNVTSYMLDLVNEYFRLCQDIKLEQTCYT